MKVRKSAQKGIQLNNKGMTLIELIVAVAILVIAATPILYGFVYSAKQNVMARERQNATVIAQTIMESCKSLSQTELDQSFATGNFLPEAEVGASAGYEHTTGSLEYYIYNAVYQNVQYDARIKLQPHGGEQAVLQYENMNGVTDAVHIGNGGPDLQAYQEMITLLLGEIVSAVDPDGTLGFTFDETALELDKLKISREIIVDTAVVDGTETATITYKYDFWCSNADNKYTFEYLDSTGIVQNGEVEFVGTYEPVAGEVIYDNSGTKAQGSTLQNIYLFYYPAYVLSDPSDPVPIPFVSDTIIVNNNVGRGLKLYLYKQKNLSMGSNLYICESHSFGSWYVKGVGSAVEVYGNLNMNIGSDPNVELAALSSRMQGTASAGAGVVGKTENEQMIYDIEVSIYEKGTYSGGATPPIADTAEAVAELNGTIVY